MHGPLMSQLMESAWFSAAMGVVALPGGLLLIGTPVAYVWAATCRAVERSYGRDALLKMRPIKILLGYGLVFAYMSAFPYALEIHFGPPLLFDVFGRHGKCVHAYTVGMLLGAGFVGWLRATAAARRRSGPPSSRNSTAASDMI